MRDEAESAKLAKLGAELQDIENHLPIDPTLRNPKLGRLAPIRVVNVVLAAGDGNRGVQTAAYNLPNDERVVREKGAKRVMLKNVQEAKFQPGPACRSRAQVLAPAQQKNVTFDAFFTHIVMHELMHGLGPHQIKVAGKDTTVRAQLKETYSAMEEAKADISGLFALQYLLDKGVLDKSIAGDDLRHVPRVGVPVDPLRRERGARQGHRAAAELAARRRRLPGGAGRDVRGEPREDQGRGDGADVRDHDAAGRGRLREGEGHARAAGRGAPGGPEGARPAQGVPVDIEPKFTTAEACYGRLCEGRGGTRCPAGSRVTNVAWPES